MAALPEVMTHSSLAMETLSKALNLSAFLPKMAFLGTSWHIWAVVKGASINSNLLMSRGRPLQTQGISLDSKSGTPGGRKRT